MMDVKKISEDHGVLKLLVKDLDVQYINAVRRTAMNQLPVLAIENIRIYQNNSVLFDEFLAHRLGMLPIQTNFKEYKKGDTTSFTLDKKGPGTVYSGDMISSDPKAEVANKKVPIVKLKEGQHVKLEMEAVAGSGDTHIKFQAAVIGYTQLPKIKHIKGKGTGKTGSLGVKSKNSYDWTPSDYEDIEKDPSLEIEFEKTSFVLDVDSNGISANTEVLMSATENLKERVEELRKAIAKL
jgi:DNA-directed RNA polymerase subunit D